MPAMVIGPASPHRIIVNATIDTTAEITPVAKLMELET